MLYILFGIFSSYIYSVLGSPITTTGTLQACPKISGLEHLQLHQIVGTWRLAYLFLGQSDDSLTEDNTCVVLDIIPNNKTEIELALFIDSAREGNIIDRSTAQFPATLITPGEWQVHFPLSTAGYLHGRVIRASDEHLVITFCGQQDEDPVMNNDLGEGLSSAEEGLDWRSLFEKRRRRKRSFGQNWKRESEVHLWTTVLVKHNNVSALKFVEYAAVLMKHGFDVTQGELVSFGTCPLVTSRQVM